MRRPDTSLLITGLALSLAGTASAWDPNGYTARGYGNGRQQPRPPATRVVTRAPAPVFVPVPVPVPAPRVVSRKPAPRRSRRRRRAPRTVVHAPPVQQVVYAPAPRPRHLVRRSRRGHGYQRSLTSGQAALAGSQFTVALEYLREARRLAAALWGSGSPQHSATAWPIVQAETALWTRGGGQLPGSFRNTMEEADAAMAAGRYRVAERLYQDALLQADEHEDANSAQQRLVFLRNLHGGQVP